MRCRSLRLKETFLLQTIHRQLQLSALEALEVGKSILLKDCWVARAVPLLLCCCFVSHRSSQSQPLEWTSSMSSLAKLPPIRSEGRHDHSFSTRQNSTSKFGVFAFLFRARFLFRLSPLSSLRSPANFFSFSPRQHPQSFSIRLYHGLVNSPRTGSISSITKVIARTQEYLNEVVTQGKEGEG